MKSWAKKTSLLRSVFQRPAAFSSWRMLAMTAFVVLAGQAATGSGSMSAEGASAISVLPPAPPEPPQQSGPAVNGPASELQSDRNDPLWSGMKALGGTLFIITLILFGSILLKRYMPHRFGPLGHRKRIHVLESVPLGEKRNLSLVQIGGSSLLLASSPTNICLIKEFGRVIDGEEVTAGGGAISPVAGSAPVINEAPLTDVHFKHALASEMAGLDNAPDFQQALARLSRIRQELEAH